MDSAVKAAGIGGLAGVGLALFLVAPGAMSALADEPIQAAVATIEELFPVDRVDPKLFRRYAITFDDSVSSEVLSTRVVRKIAHGRSSDVTIVTTPSGTYSTDGILSPNVRYPGIDVESKRNWSYIAYGFSSSGGSWTSFSNGSFIYFFQRGPAART